MKWHVRYYYLATGMEGRADEEDFGVVEANTDLEARQIVAMRECSEDTRYGPDNAWSTRDFFLGCLRATPVT